jgi:hypothetical protein
MKYVVLIIIAVATLSCATLRNIPEKRSYVCSAVCALHSITEGICAQSGATYWRVIEGAQDATECAMICQDNYDSLYGYLNYDCVSDLLTDIVNRRCPDLGACR